MPLNPILAGAADHANDLFKALAVIVGAGWTYLNYVRGRTFRKRLEIEITGTVLKGSVGATFFSGQCRLKNVGLSQTKIEQLGTGVTIYALYASIRTDGDPYIKEREVIALPLFVNHGWVEPGESIVEPFATALPVSDENLLAVRTDVLISNGKTTWSAARICESTFARDEK